jgi:predicted Zn-dependent protease
MILNKTDDALKYANKGLKLKPLSENMKLELNYQTALINKAKGDKKNALKIFQKIYDSNKSFKSVEQEIRQLSK